MPRRALRGADIARRGFEDVLPRLPLLRMRHAIEGAAQAVGRFAAIEHALAAKGKKPQDATLAEMDALWDAAKTRE